MQKVETIKTRGEKPLREIPVESSYIATSSKKIVSGERTPRKMTHRLGFGCLRSINRALLPHSNFDAADVNEVSEL